MLIEKIKPMPKYIEKKLRSLIKSSIQSKLAIQDITHT